MNMSSKVIKFLTCHLPKIIYMLDQFSLCFCSWTDEAGFYSAAIEINQLS